MTNRRRALVGLCVGAALLVAAGLYGAGPRVVHSAAAAQPVSQPSGAGDDFTVQTLEDVVVVPAAPSSVAVIAGLAVVLASGRQLHHDRRQRPS